MNHGIPVIDLGQSNWKICHRSSCTHSPAPTRSLEIFKKLRRKQFGFLLLMDFGWLIWYPYLLFSFFKDWVNFPSIWLSLIWQSHEWLHVSCSNHWNDGDWVGCIYIPARIFFIFCLLPLYLLPLYLLPYYINQIFISYAFSSCASSSYSLVVSLSY